MKGRKRRRRKGSLAMDTLFYIPRLMFFIFVALTIVLLIRQYISYSIDVGDAEIEVQANRMVYSCLAYYDVVLDKRMPGVIDMDLFSSFNMDMCMRYGEWNDYLSMTMTLRPVDDPEGIIAEAVYNAQGRDAWVPRLGKPGAGGAYMRRVRRYIVYEDAGVLEPAILDIVAIVPNR